MTIRSHITPNTSCQWHKNSRWQQTVWHWHVAVVRPHQQTLTSQLNVILYTQKDVIISSYMDASGLIL